MPRAIDTHAWGSPLVPCFVNKCHKAESQTENTFSKAHDGHHLKRHLFSTQWTKLLVKCMLVMPEPTSSTLLRKMLSSSLEQNSLGIQWNSLFSCWYYWIKLTWRWMKIWCPKPEWQISRLFHENGMMKFSHTLILSKLWEIRLWWLYIFLSTLWFALTLGLAWPHQHPRNSHICQFLCMWLLLLLVEYISQCTKCGSQALSHPWVSSTGDPDVIPHVPPVPVVPHLAAVTASHWVFCNCPSSWPLRTTKSRKTRFHPRLQFQPLLQLWAWSSLNSTRLFQPLGFFMLRPSSAFGSSPMMRPSLACLSALDAKTHKIYHSLWLRRRPPSLLGVPVWRSPAHDVGLRIPVHFLHLVTHGNFSGDNPPPHDSLPLAKQRHDKGSTGP